MTPLDQIRLRSLSAATAGRPDITVAIIDGPVDLGHPAFRGARARAPRGANQGVCSQADSAACRHGTFVAGVLFARRGLPAAAICPQCDLLLRPIFHERGRSDRSGVPRTSPGELATAIVETVDAGAHVINLSVGLSRASLLARQKLDQACDYARRRGVVVVAASGNQNRMGHDPLVAHPWTLPVAGCDGRGRLCPESNLSPSIAKRGVMAPGVNITSTSPGGRYTRMSGSSVAVPFVTGTVALLLARFPRASPAEVRHAVLEGAAGRRKAVAPPLLNAERAWRLLRSGCEPTPHVFLNTEETMAREQALPETPNPTTAHTSVAPAENDALSPEEQPTFVDEGQDSAPPSRQYGTADRDSPDESSGRQEERSFVYALGTIAARFPTMAVEMEFTQAIKAESTAKLTDAEVLHAILEKNGYLAREVCWVLTIEGIEVYILVPSAPEVLAQLVAAVKPAERGADCDVVIGTRGPLASADLCNGLVVPLVLADQIYSFDVPALIKSIPKPRAMAEKPFRSAAAELFQTVQQLADNVGAVDEHRALNYLAVRYPAVYSLIAEMHDQERSLSGVEMRPSRLSGVRTLLDAVLSFTNRKTDVVEKYYARVDVTEKYPFLVSKLAPFYDRV